MTALKRSVRRVEKRSKRSRKPSSRSRAPTGEVTFLGDLESVGAVVETAGGVDSEEFFFLYVPQA